MIREIQKQRLQQARINKAKDIKLTAKRNKLQRELNDERAKIERHISEERYKLEKERLELLKERNELEKDRRNSYRQFENNALLSLSQSQLLPAQQTVVVHHPATNQPTEGALPAQAYIPQQMPQAIAVQLPQGTQITPQSSTIFMP